MIDTHCHILPGLDDGPDSPRQAVELARALVEDGVTHVIATPHVSHRWSTGIEQAAEAAALLSDALATEGVALGITVAAELTPSKAVSLDGDGLRGRAIGGRYLLVEALPDTPRATFELVFDRLHDAGLLPVFAHPERCQAFRRDPRTLDGLRRRGALLQVVAPSLVSTRDARVRETAWWMVENDRADLLATDAHGPQRPPRLGEAASEIARRVSPEAAIRLTHEAPGRILGDEAAAARTTPDRTPDPRMRVDIASPSVQSQEPVRGRGGAARSSRIRVAYLDHCARLSGAQLALVRLLEEFTDIDAHVILAEDGPLVSRLEDAGASVEVLPMSEGARGLPLDRIRPGSLPFAALRDSARYVARVARHLRRRRPQLIHTNSLKAAIYGGLAGRYIGVPVIWHVRDRIAADYMPRSAVRLVHASTRLPTVIVANSQATLDTVRTPRRPSHVIPSLVRMPPPRERRAPERGGELVIGMLGRIAPWKGQRLFLEGFADAFAGGGARGVIVGSPLFGEEDYAAGLPRLAAELGIVDQVEFAGFREDVDEILAGWDVLVHASIVPEPFGQVVVEGMASGLAVVAAGAGGPLEYVDNEANGLLYRPGDAPALAAALRRLAADEALRRRLGDAARASVARFAPAVVVNQWMTVYRETLAVNSVMRG